MVEDFLGVVDKHEAQLFPELLRYVFDITLVSAGQDHLAEAHAVCGQHLLLAALGAGYRLGLDSDVITTMPRIKLLPENNVRKGFAEAKHVETICKRLSPDVADGVRFAFSTGWRRAEVFTLAWSQVDWNGGFVRLEPGTTKNQEGRAFPITPALRAILERRQELPRRCERAQARIIPLVFHRSGRPIHSFRRSWKKVCEKAGLRACSSTIFDAAPCGTWSAPVCRGRWR